MLIERYGGSAMRSAFRYSIVHTCYRAATTRTIGHGIVLPPHETLGDQGRGYGRVRRGSLQGLGAACWDTVMAWCFGVLLLVRTFLLIDVQVAANMMELVAAQGTFSPLVTGDRSSAPIAGTWRSWFGLQSETRILM